MAAFKAFGNKYGVKHGQYGTRLYGIWCGMKQRCQNKNFPHYQNYGGRGIAICAEWPTFVQFFSWAIISGYRGDLEIDRIDNDGPYSPQNCRWVTAQENSNNKRTNLRLPAFGEVKTMAQWSRDPRCVVGWSTLKFRIRDGWLPERAIVEAPQHPFRGNQHA